MPPHPKPLQLNFTCVSPDVRLQMRRFPVNSVAAIESARMPFNGGAGGPPSSRRPHLRLGWAVLPGGRRGAWGHGGRRGCGVGQRGVSALPARRVAAFGVGRHGAEFAVEVRQDPGHRHYTGAFLLQGVPNLFILPRPLGLPERQGRGGTHGGRSHRRGSVEDGSAGYGHQALGS